MTSIPDSKHSSLAATIARTYREWWATTIDRSGVSAWRLLWTGVFAVQVALFISLCVWLFSGGREASTIDDFLNTLHISLWVSYSIHGLHWFGAKVLKRAGIAPASMTSGQRLLYFGSIPFVGMIIGLVMYLLVKGYNPIATLVAYPKAVLSMLGISVLITLGMFIVWLQREHKLTLIANVERGNAQVHELQRQSIEAELRVLQSQIEPHFLFNTLANVVSLMDYDAPLAKRMLEAFIDYLRSSLDANRRTQATVGDELQLVERYLQLLQIRLGTRLRYAIVAEPQVRELSLAPLMLQPLVENAVKYGIEPNIEGGGVSITARVENHQLILTVHDDSAGLHAASTARKGSGTALTNIRERLSALYGLEASLSLSSDTPALAGTLATIRIPIHAEITHTNRGAT